MSKPPVEGKVREIKFRIWDKEAKKIRPVNSLHLVTDQDGEFLVECYGKSYVTNEGDRDAAVDVIRGHNFELMQFTGLHDKNGIEIFEGDLGFYLETEIKIRWSEILARWVMDARHSDDPRWYDGKFDINPQIAKDVRITGNIWES